MIFNFLINLIFVITNIFYPLKGYTNNLYSISNSISSYNSNISLAPMLEKVLPSVVSVYTEGVRSHKYHIPKEFKYFFGQEIPNNKHFEGLGSGVIINSKKGYVITNYHVVNGANRIKIKLNDDREFNAKLIGSDKKTDISILQLIDFKDIFEIKIANSDDIKVGDFVVAIGNPFGLGQTATSGIISALGRSSFNSNKLENFIQTDASINKGNSGGALININGELIGINTAILAPSGGNIGIGFAIPSNIVKNLSDQLIKYGKVKRGKLGIKGTELTPDIAKAFKIDAKKGAFINEVISGSAAHKAGIKAGDIIVSINGKEIKNFSELRVKIGITHPGKTIQIGILRNGILKNINVKLDDSLSYKLGKKVLIPLLQGAILKNSQNKNNIKGIQVEDVNENSKAYLIGLRKGDLIIGINKEKVDDLNQLIKILDKSFDLIAINILRDNTKIFLFFKK